MRIRLAVLDDLDCIMEIYKYAKQFMAATGNPTQWGDGYPERELVLKDIQRQQCYICEEHGQAAGVFVFIVGDDPTYKVIRQGRWRNCAPYGTIHRLAGNGTCRGVAKHCFDFCKKEIDNLRADTHHDNIIMQHLLEEYGFERCGIIYVRDHSPRIAYHYIRSGSLI